MAFPEKYYVSDTFEEYSNGIDFLSDILYPYFDKEMKEAEEIYEKLKNKNPKNIYITYLLGLLYSQTQRPSNAIKNIENRKRESDKI